MNDPTVQLLLVLFGTGGVVVALIAAVRAMIPDAAQRMDREEKRNDRLDALDQRHHDEIKAAREYMQVEINRLRDRYDRLEEVTNERIGHLENENSDLLKSQHSLVIENARLQMLVKDMEGHQLTIVEYARRIGELEQANSRLETEVKALRIQLGQLQTNGSGGTA